MTTAEQRLGNLIRARRRDLGLYTVVDAARRADISRDTLAKVEAGERAKPVTYRKLEQALDWAPGSIDRILDGGDPAAKPSPDPAPLRTPDRALADETIGLIRQLTNENAELRAQVEEVEELRAEVARLRAEVERYRGERSATSV
jgi:transcriptional regulator with XRE-family HTH domain